MPPQARDKDAACYAPFMYKVWTDSEQLIHDDDGLTGEAWTNAATVWDGKCGAEFWRNPQSSNETAWSQLDKKVVACAGQFCAPGGQDTQNGVCATTCGHEKNGTRPGNGCSFKLNRCALLTLPAHFASDLTPPPSAQRMYAPQPR